MHRLIVIFVCAAPFASAQNFYSPEKEAALGAQLAVQVREQSTVVENVMSQYVERLGSKLAAVLPASDTKYTFTVVEQNLGGSTHEPVALPGGYIFVPTELVRAARNEDELAGMLAHAIGHVAARHGTRQATRAQTLDIMPVRNVFISSRAGDESLLPMELSSLQRAFESEADQLAVGITRHSGYDPEGFAGYIARLQYDGTRSESSALPPHDERVAAIHAAIQHQTR